MGSCADAREDTRIVAGRRVISLVPSVTDLIVVLGADQYLVGRTRYDTAPELAMLPSIGGTADPSIEAIVALEPDLVLTWRDSTAPGAAERLRSIGIAVHTVGTWTIADLRATIAELGRLFAAERAADSLLRTLDDSLAAIRASSVAARPVRVLYMLSERPLMTVGGGTFIDEVIEVAGGRNIFHDQPPGWPTVSMEEVVRRDPELVIVPAVGDGPKRSEHLAQTPGLARTSAARAGRIVAVPADLFDRPGPRLVVAARALATLIRRSRADTSAAIPVPSP